VHLSALDAKLEGGVSD